MPPEIPSMVLNCDASELSMFSEIYFGQAGVISEHSTNALSVRENGPEGCGKDAVGEFRYVDAFPQDEPVTDDLDLTGLNRSF